MTLYRSSAPPSMAEDARRRSPGWRWPLRVTATVMTALLFAQPMLIGLFLGGDFSKLAAHATVGGLAVAVTLLQFVAAVLAWRPGGLPGWVVAAGAAMVVGAVVQIAAGYQRNLGLHVPLGVSLAATGLLILGRAWWPTRTPGPANQSVPQQW